MKKMIIIFVLAIFGNIGAKAQLRLNLNLLPDNETYMVSMVPDQTIAAPMNTTSNAQVIFHVPSKAPFTVGQLKSLVPGVTWLASSYSDELTGEQPHLFVISMEERSTTAFQFEENKEVPLFTFKNMETEGCAGKLEILDNEHEIITEAVANGKNYTQNFTVLAARGNAFDGIINGEADCSLTNSDEIFSKDKVNIFPIPADDFLTVEWENVNFKDDLQMHLISYEGKKVNSFKGIGQTGEQSLVIDTKDWASGIYTLRFLSDGSVQDFKFIISRL